MFFKTIQRNLMVVLLGLFVFCVSSFGEVTEQKAQEPEVRAVWVSCLGPGLRSPEEIDKMLEAVRKGNLNTVIAQIRSRGTVLFNSEIEPRNPKIEGPQGFDPLEYLLKAARDTSDGKQKLDVYAWFNTFHIGPQKDLKHLKPEPISVSHREWYTQTKDGTVEYELDPGVPEVQDYNISVIEECLKKYDVDGVNLDFVRYFEMDRGYNPVAVKRFQLLTGRDDIPSPSDEQWSDFRREQVDNFVKRCAISVWRLCPEAKFSVDAVGFWKAPEKDFSETDPYSKVFQDWAGWAEKGYLDVVCRMGYKQESVPKHADQFRGWADFTRQLQDKCEGRLLTVGIGGYFNSKEDTVVQYKEALKRNLGTTLFSYNRPVKEKPNAFESSAWEVFGREIYPKWVDPPKPTWRSQKSFIAGFLKDKDGKIIDGGKIILVGRGIETTSDGSGFWGFFDLEPGEYTIQSEKGEIENLKVNVGKGEIWFGE